VAFGQNAGSNNQGEYAVAIGYGAGATGQGLEAVAIGDEAGANTQGQNSVAIGKDAGNTTQGRDAVAIGRDAGKTTQGGNAVAMGRRAGDNSQGTMAVAIGEQAGMTDQGQNAVAIGRDAGNTTQGTSAVAVGNYAGYSNQAANTIILNATGLAVNGVEAQTSSFYVAPIRNATGTHGVLQYNTTTNEVTYSNEITINNSTWTFGTDGKLTAPGNLQVDGGKIILNSAGNAYVESVDYGVNSANSAVNIFGGPYQKIKLRAGFGTEATWNFGTDGNLVLPAGGTITEGGGLTGAIRLTPAGGTNEYQALVIYPTGTGDGDHIHLTAGGGTTDLYLGSDLQYVKIENGGHVVIQAADGVDSGLWLFDKNGDLTAPGNIILNNPVTTVTTSVTGTVADSNGNPFTFRILKADNPQLVTPFADPNFVLKWTGSDAGSAAAAAQAPGGQGPSSLVSDDGTYWNFNSWFGLNSSRPNTGTVFTVEYGVVVSDTMISTTDTNLVIEADAKQYKFGTDGNLTLPAGGDIVDSNGTSVLGGGSSFSGSYTDLTNKPTIPADISNLTDTTGLLPAAQARYETKNANFTAEVFKTYWLNSGTTAKTVTLPASPTTGDWVKIYDGSLNWSTYNLTVNGNGNQIRVVNMMSPPVSWDTAANSVTLTQSAISPNGPLGVIFNWDGTYWNTAA
jgi:hypothetical protein